VAKAASKVTLALSAARVTYGHEGSERLTVKVTGKSGREGHRRHPYPDRRLRRQRRLHRLGLRQEDPQGREVAEMESASTSTSTWSLGDSNP